MRLKQLATLLTLLALIFLHSVTTSSAAPPMQQSITFTAEELLGRPTATSITVNIVPAETIEYYYEYGTVSGEYTAQTALATAAGGQPHEVVISGLQPDTRYYYRMQYRVPGDSGWVARTEHTFHTQRSPGAEFTFTITSDSHVNILLGNGATWQQTLSNVAGDSPDFHLDLGDTFAMDNVTTVAGAEQAYLSQRSSTYLGQISPLAPIFLATGNHEQEEAWHLDDTGNPATSQPVLGTNARKKYFLNPVPDTFYSGNPDPYAYLDGDHLREDYYAWTWGDALFVVIDPFWYTTTKPFTGNTGGGESSDTGSGDRWDWTLGEDQFNWLKQTLEASSAKYKFIFAHHYTGGSDDYVRGGAVPAHIGEWGGYNENGTTWAWETERPGWGSQPVHQLMVENNASAFFHGHDHQYAYEVRDGIVYQSLPAAGFSGNGFNLYRESDPYTEKVLPSPGHLRVVVSSEQATVDYIATSGGTVNHSYTILPNPVSTDPAITLTGVPLAEFTGEPGSPSAERSYTVSGSNLTADITITPPGDFEISLTSGSGWTSSPLTLTPSGGAVAQTDIYVRFNRATAGTSTGNIAHTSAGATPRNIAVSGTAAVIVPGAVSLDGAVSSHTADGVSSISVSHTTGTGTNRLMLVGVSANSYGTARTISSVTFTPTGGSAASLTLVGSVENESGRLAAIYSLLNPPGGVSGTVTVTFSGSVANGIVMGVANFAGVDPVTPLGIFASNTGTDTTPTVNVTTDANDLVFDTVFLGTQTMGSLAAGDSQTSQWNGTIDRVRGAASTRLATTSMTQMSWTVSGGATSRYWAIVAVPINPAPAATTHDLTIATAGSGSGTVTPAVGVHTYPKGTAVTLEAAADTGSTFAGWSGDGGCADGSVTMDANKTCTATFSLVEPGILGSVNGDTAVNSTDALIILSCDVGIDTTEYCPLNCGDVNGDGFVNSTDALLILSYDVGLTVPYPVGQRGCPANVTAPPGCNP